MLSLILALLLQVANPPEIRETKDRIIQVIVPAGATDVCIYARRETKVEPDTNWPDGYYTPSSCVSYGEPIELEQVYQTGMWGPILAWFESRGEPTSEWTVWAEIKLPLASSDLAEPKFEIRKTPEYKVTR